MENNGKWLLVDDLQDHCLLYNSLPELYSENNSGWFFAVYKKVNMTQHIHAHSYSPPVSHISLDHSYVPASQFKTNTSNDNLVKGTENFLSLKNKEILLHVSACDKVSKRQNTAKISKCDSNINTKKRKRTAKTKMNGFPFPLAAENKSIEEMKSFHASIKKKIIQCCICFEAWPNKESLAEDSDYICTRCTREKGHPKKFSKENNMFPGSVPLELEGLTQCEEMLIARAFTVMQVYLKPRFGSLSYRGHIVTLPHNVQNIVDILPRCPKDLPIVIFSVKGNNTRPDATFKVRRQKVLDALVWLKSNNPLYANVII